MFYVDFQKLSAVQQLQLADIILEYLSIPREENDRLALFNSIFYSINFQSKLCRMNIDFMILY